MKTQKGRRHMMYVLAALLCFNTQSHCSSLLDFKEAYDNFFSQPVFNFGAYFFVGFPDGILAQLYECICDIRITKCKITYAFDEDLNSGLGFPFYFIVTGVQQVRTSEFRNLKEIYSPHMICDALSMNNLGGLTCRRQRRDDTICEKRRCKEYSVELSGDTCSFSCGKLIWKSDYELKIIYSNFGDIPEPVEDGVCPEDSSTTTIVTPSVSSTVVRDIINSSETVDDSVEDPGPEKQTISKQVESDRRGGGSMNKTTSTDGSIDGFSFKVFLAFCAVVILVLFAAKFRSSLNGA